MKETSFVKVVLPTPSGEIGWTIPVDTDGCTESEAVQKLTLTTHHLRDAILGEFSGPMVQPREEDAAEESPPRREGRRRSSTGGSRRRSAEAEDSQEEAPKERRRRRGRRGRTESTTEEARPKGRGRGRRAAKESTEEAEEAPAARRSGRGRRKATKTTEKIAPIVDQEVADNWLDETASLLFAKFVDLESGAGTAKALSDTDYEHDFEADMKELIGSPVAEIYKLTVPQFEKLTKETEKAMKERLEDDDDLDEEE